MREFLGNKNDFKDYLNEKNIEKKLLNFNLQSFEWYPGNLMMGNVILFLLRVVEIRFSLMSHEIWWFFSSPEPQIRCKLGHGRDPTDVFEECAHTQRFFALKKV